MFFVSNLIKKSNVLGVHKLSLEGWRVLRTSKKNKKALCWSLVGSPGWLRARCWVTGLVLLALAVSVALLICHGPWDLHHQAHNGRDYSRDYGYDDIELVKEQRLRLLVHGNIFFLTGHLFLLILSILWENIVISEWKIIYTLCAISASNCLISVFTCWTKSSYNHIIKLFWSDFTKAGTAWFRFD